MLNNINTYTELKREYRRLSRLHHPDRGGDTATFVQLNDLHKQKQIELSKQWESILTMITSKPGYNVDYEVKNFLQHWNDKLNAAKAKITPSTPQLMRGLYQKEVDKIQAIVNQISGFTTQPIPTNPKTKTTTPKPQPQNQAKKQSQANTPNATYDTITMMIEFFINELFTIKLPTPMIRFKNKPGMLGSMSYQKNWQNQRGGAAYELGLNPVYFSTRSLKDLCSTIAHELVHLWQMETSTKPPSPGYHNKEWVTKMQSIGLEPIGQNGKQTGMKVDHAIVFGGGFEIAFNKFIAAHPGLTIDWFDNSQNGRSTSKKGKRKKLVCPSCSLKAWAKTSAKLVCGDCMTAMV